MATIKVKNFALLTLATLLEITILAGCSTNTVLDDSAYRAIGVSAHRASPLTTQLPESKAPTWLGAAKPSPGNSEHVVRYGHEGLIRKIVKTAAIHCQPFNSRIDTDKLSYWGQSKGVLTQCTYQFPSHCGSHRFAVISYHKKRALAYLEKGSPYYVIDLFEGTPAAKPGLWDKDDRIGSKANNMGYMLDNNYNRNHQIQEHAPLHLGWVIQASFDDETTHGKRYHQAVSEIAECF